MDIRHAPNDYDWKLVEADNAAAASSSVSKKRKQDFNIYDNAIYPLLPPLGLLPVSAKQLDFLKRHCRELHKLALTYVLLTNENGGLASRLSNFVSLLVILTEMSTYRVTVSRVKCATPSWKRCRSCASISTRSCIVIANRRSSSDRLIPPVIAVVI